MDQNPNKDEMLVRIDMVNGIPKVTLLSAEEQEQFFKTHPNANVPIFSPADVSQTMKKPSTTNPSAK